MTLGVIIMSSGREELVCAVKNFFVSEGLVSVCVLGFVVFFVVVSGSV
jgi:hypothetical protein